MSAENNSSEKQPLRGFAKGWTIFMIVYASAFAATLFPYLSNPSVVGIMLPILLFAAGMIVGLVFMLKKRKYGFWILLASSLLITLMSGMKFRNYTVFSSGGLVLVLLTFLFTRKQLFIRKQDNTMQMNASDSSVLDSGASNNTAALSDTTLNNNETIQSNTDAASIEKES